MLSYQHIYHAGNLADVHKHTLLALMLDYLTRKEKPLTYFETHAGRGVYNLSSVEALKTQEASQGILNIGDWFSSEHPYMKCLKKVTSEYNASYYPGSPLIAAHMLRKWDTMHLCELHPQEYAALKENTDKYYARSYKGNGFEKALSFCPPTPRRGLMLIDPSYEIKSDYDYIPKFITQIHRKWNVGVISLWYPILKDMTHLTMRRTLEQSIPEIFIHEVGFPPASKDHRMIGSGMAIINAPYNLPQEATTLSKKFTSLHQPNT